MLTMSALLFASAVAAPPKYYWEQKKPDHPVAEQKKPEPKPEKPKPPGLCKKFPYACSLEHLLGGVGAGGAGESGGEGSAGGVDSAP